MAVEQSNNQTINQYCTLFSTPARFIDVAFAISPGYSTRYVENRRGRTILHMPSYSSVLVHVWATRIDRSRDRTPHNSPVLVLSQDCCAGKVKFVLEFKCVNVFCLFSSFLFVETHEGPHFCEFRGPKCLNNSAGRLAYRYCPY
jgi:hypothetical protein